MKEYKYDIFISYSKKNQKWVNRLVNDLKNHDIRVWIDSVDIYVGDIFREKIEEGIKNSKYFCLIISNQSMKSYFVRKLELEAAFKLMSSKKRESFILPIIYIKPKKSLPLMLGQYQYLDFSKKANYNNNLFKLLSKIRFNGYPFTGFKYYKNIDVSPQGVFVGIAEIGGMSYSGHCVRIHYEKGKAQKVEMFIDGKIDCYKTIHYKNGLVYEIVKFRKDKREEKLVYSYNKKGIRNFKFAYKDGDVPVIKLSYDENGKRVQEEFFNQDGSRDNARGYSMIEFIYNLQDRTKLEVRKDNTGKEVKKLITKF